MAETETKRQTCLSSFEEGLDTIFNLVNAEESDEQRLIVVAGSSCSGKSHFASLLEAYLDIFGVAIIHMDPYFKNIDDPTLYDRPINGKESWENGGVNYDRPRAYHLDEFIEAVQLLLQGESVIEPLYDTHSNMRKAGGRKIDPAKIIIAEGLYAIDALGGFKNCITVYIDIEKKIQLQRIVERNNKFGIDEELTTRVFETIVYPCQKELECQKENANIVIKNDYAGKGKTIAVCGPARSGKTTLAEEIVSSGYRRVSFGDVFKKYLLREKGFANPTREILNEESDKLLELTDGHKGSMSWLRAETPEIDWKNGGIVVELRNPEEVLSLISDGIDVVVVYCDVPKKIRKKRIEDIDKKTPKDAAKIVSNPAEKDYPEEFLKLAHILYHDGDDSREVAKKAISLAQY